MPKADTCRSTRPIPLASDLPHSIQPRRGFLAGAALAVPSCAVAAPAMASDGPDAELIRLCEEHIRRHAAYNEHGGYLECEDDPLWHAYEATWRAVSDAEPQTLLGMVAKARAAKVEAQQPGDAELWHNTTAGTWAAHLVDDLLRLAGRA